MNHIKTILFITLSLLFSSQIIFAEDKDWTFDPKTSALIPKYMGLVKVIQGKAMVEERELQKGSKVYAMDLIKTFDKSALVIELIDLTKITLGANSEFQVEKWNYRTKNDREAVFSILKGQWRGLVISKAKEKEQLKVKTPLISMGIRGTELLVNVNGQSDLQTNQVALLEGEVHIYGSSPESDKDLHPGDHTIVTKTNKGLDNIIKKLTAEEIKEFEGFSFPGIPHLLKKIQNTLSNERESLDQINSENKININESTINENSISKNKSFKDKLNELNKIWEKK